MEHTQMHPASKKDTKNFHYTSNSCGIFVIAIFHETKIPIVDMKVQVYSNLSNKNIFKKNEISKLHEDWKISSFQV
jgi:hypothetical protein